MSEATEDLKGGQSHGLPLVHPGEILADDLNALGLSARGLARSIKVPPNRVTAILNGHRGISADTALRLSRFFGTSAGFWMNLQRNYDLMKAERQDGARIMRSVQPLGTSAV